jgi:hypothetical protein
MLMKKIGVIINLEKEEVTSAELFFKDNTEHTTYDGKVKGEVVLEDYYGRRPCAKIKKSIYFLNFLEEEHNGDFLYEYRTEEVAK